MDVRRWTGLKWTRIWSTDDIFWRGIWNVGLCRSREILEHVNHSPRNTECYGVRRQEHTNQNLKWPVFDNCLVLISVQFLTIPNEIFVVLFSLSKRILPSTVSCLFISFDAKWLKHCLQVM
jgi:hypothetical protein